MKQRSALQTAPSQVRTFQTRLLCSLHFSRENWEQGCSLLQTKTRWAAEQLDQASGNISRSHTWMLWLFSGMGVQLVEVGFLTRVPLSWPILNVLDVSLAEQGLGNSYSVIFWNKNKHILKYLFKWLILILYNAKRIRLRYN